ncbi:conserved protein, unknown function, partial [Hepatocystis sp. ex Piliocolobus tephrosceles]
FRRCKKNLLNILENDHANYSTVNNAYSAYTRALNEIKEKTLELLKDGEYNLYCKFIDEIQEEEEEELNIRYESYLLNCQNNSIEKKEMLNNSPKENLEGS